MKKEQSCGNCKFWFLDSEEFTYGDCRIRRPTVMGDDGACTFPAVHQETWCGEWRSADGRIGQKLYQMPNGSWVDPSDVRRVSVIEGSYSATSEICLAPRVQVVFSDNGLCIISCATQEDAEAMRDKIAEDVNRLTGEVKK